jgi:nucleoid-associated protein Lsr2
VEVEQRTQVILEDDLDGSGADHTVQFGVNGVTYEIDLSQANAGKLDSALQPFIKASRRISGSRSTPKRAATTNTKTDPEQLKAIRAWAKDNGHKVSDRGRISAEVVTAYESAH